ncbi:histidine kinase [Methylocella silvestris BL2]|uniref:histidine kinase n=1 Tax=Methylocella silvestris (strain DSM 15510 / CIP 108128 / LMG 27833 / NCIMB 13906 / BL2) TaxID=395965 RepID=B8EKN3_METSB|nr:response regulator [Methylocella silvestris]ACK51403.1 histidine kinase [Methylocella silvestris BL2]
MAANDKVNILLVDDQPGKLLSYEAILDELQENLIKAASAREAFAHLLKTEVAVILIDVCMPELDGYELAGMIREHPRFETVAIIFVSAIQITDPDRLRGYEAGAVDYVQVPVVPEVLRAQVKVFAELHRKTRQLERLNEELEERVAERTAALEQSSAELKRLNQDLETRIDARTREREQALAQLFEAQKVDAIGQLTGGVAHDFNNLLTAIMGSLELLKKRLPDEPRISRLVDTAMQGAERGAALTQRLLAFSRRQELKPEAVDVAQLVNGMEELLRRALGPGVSIEKRLPDDLRFARVDGNQLELALINLAVNARDAMPSGGAITIAAANEIVAAQSPGKAISPGAYVRISVIDEGQGMDAATLAKAADPFFTTKGPSKGTGLGLSMVQGLAVQSGGAIEISSRVGAGTTVELWLPQAEFDEPRKRAAPDARKSWRADLAPCTVLLVDDDLLVSAGASSILEDLGHSVIEAHSGAEALRLLQNGSAPDLVITDYAMPGMTGLELARAIRASYPALPIVLASGYAELPHLGLDEKPLPRLAKPFRQDELLAAMAEASGR